MALALLWFAIAPRLQAQSLRQRIENIQGLLQASWFFSQNQFIAAALDLELFALDAKLFGQPHCLAVARFEYSCGGNRKNLVRMYIRQVYTTQAGASAAFLAWAES